MSILHGVVDEPAHEHLRGGHHPEELTVVANLHHIIGGGSSRTTQTIGGTCQGLDQGTFRLTHIAFQNARIVDQQAIYAERGMSCCAKVIEIDVSLSIPQALQLRMSRFQNLKTVHPSEASLASFF